MPLSTRLKHTSVCKRKSVSVTLLRHLACHVISEVYLVSPSAAMHLYLFACLHLTLRFSVCYFPVFVPSHVPILCKFGQLFGHKRLRCSTNLSKVEPLLIFSCLDFTAATAVLASKRIVQDHCASSEFCNTSVTV